MYRIFSILSLVVVFLVACEFTELHAADNESSNELSLKKATQSAVTPDESFNITFPITLKLLDGSKVQANFLNIENTSNLVYPISFTDSNKITIKVVRDEKSNIVEMEMIDLDGKEEPKPDVAKIKKTQKSKSKGYRWSFYDIL